MILRTLLRRKLRTSFTVIGIALAIGAMVSLTAVTQGVLSEFEQLIGGYRGDVVVFKKGVPDPIFSMLDENLEGDLATLPNVKAAYPLAITMTKLSGFPFFLIMGLPAGSELTKRHKIISGETYVADEMELILGAIIAEDLEKEVGDILTLNRKEFKISGIFETGLRILDTSSIMSIPNALSMSLTGKVNMFCLDMVDPETQIQPLLDSFPDHFDDLEAFKADTLLDNFDQVQTIRTLSMVVSVISICIAAVGILNTMMMSVFERTREIGLLRSLGWSGGMIMSMILGEGLILSLLGGLLGIGVGVVGTETLLRVLSLGALSAAYPIGLFRNVVVFSILMGLFGALLPAWKATTVSPVEALRYE